MLVEVEKKKIVQKTLLKIMLCECFIMYRTAVNKKKKEPLMIEDRTLERYMDMLLCIFV